jgi:hypothetical protein
MADRFPFVHLPEVLVKARSHARQGSIKLKKIALEESNILLAGFVAGLTESELTAATHTSVIRSYAGLAANLRLRGFGGAARCAAQFVAKNRGRETVRDDILAISTLLRCALINAPLGRLRRSLSLFRGRYHKALESVRRLRQPRHQPMQYAGLKDKFSQIYFRNIFGGSASRSGEGSNLVQTEKIRCELPGLMQRLGVKTFVDAPCGDWHWMRKTALGVEQYIGVDIVEALIETNGRLFGNASHAFLCLNMVEDPLPRADLIFCRDCLVHLAFDEAKNVIGNFKRSKSRYLLTTTFTNCRKNTDLVSGRIWRPLNLNLPPFNFPAPLMLINENCTEENGRFADKCLGLWLLEEIVQ